MRWALCLVAVCAIGSLGEARDIRQDIPVEVPEIGNYATACSVRTTGDMPRPQPLVLIPGTDQFRYPSTNNGLLQLNAGETLELACQNGFALFPGKTSIIITCVINDQFNYDSQMIAFRDFACTENWLSSARRTAQRCFNGATIVEIGFNVGPRFPKILDVCHDEVTFDNHYVVHEFTPANDGFQQGVPRPGWYQGDFYPGVNINGLYTVNTQRATVATILGSQSRANELVQGTDNGIFMARGHIAARADFIYGTQQNATFWFLNAAPQWQNFNAGNWERIESSVKSFVAMRNIRVRVYGGTWGVQTQANGNGDHQQIFLDFDANGRRRVRAPMVYYKILHNEAQNSGIVLIGVNNVHISLEEIRRDYIFCTDVSSRIGWINWERENLALGYSYASGGCTVPFASLPYPAQPLILIPGSEKFWHPQDETRQILFPTSAPVELVCRDGFILFPEKRSITIECVANDTFAYDGNHYPMVELACTSYWLSSARTTQERCFNGSSIVNVGFNLAANRWVNVFDVCYDESLYHTHFVRHHMNRANGGYQSGNPRPSWYQGAYYEEVNINTLYTVNRQRETMAIILNSQPRADELVQNTSNGIYMARGHIAARADFVYGTEQNATFWFLNAAPQWQNFNGINWERVESSIRDFLGQRDLEVTVYSGTYGVQKLADGNGDYREIWLDFDPTEGRRRAPAPMLYYKILHDERNNAGIAIVGVNNVHIPTELILREYVLCKDIGDQVEWIDWQRTNVTIGYCYACEVNAFNAAIGNPHPNLNVAKLLTSGAGKRFAQSLWAMMAGLGLHGVLFFVRSALRVQTV
uniref:DNA/RNA non-specific endonuclease/pyrophosphatase/phosphodiesterase domain-containing protein n=1 Tax=Anopheles stephensi TaxID=30069 RepID=A0A182YBI7_ANOST